MRLILTRTERRMVLWAILKVGSGLGKRVTGLAVLWLECVCSSLQNDVGLDDEWHICYEYGVRVV